MSGPDEEYEEVSDEVQADPFLLLAGNKEFLAGRRSRPVLGPGTVPAAAIGASLALVLFTVPLVLLVFELLAHMQLRSLRGGGQRAEAVVMEIHKEPRKLGHVCLVAYQFRQPQQPKTAPAIDGADELPPGFCTWFEDHSQELCTPKGIHPCDRGSVMVVYDGARPSKSMVDHDRGTTRMWITGAVALFFGAIAAWVGVIVARIFLRNRMFAARGKRVGGFVTSAHISRSKANKIDLQYVFSNPAGQEIEGKIVEFWDKPAGTPPPMPGTPLMVLYVDDRCHKVL
jgi:hypothetical protein